MFKWLRAVLDDWSDGRARRRAQADPVRMAEVDAAMGRHPSVRGRHVAGRDDVPLGDELFGMGGDRS